MKIESYLPQNKFDIESIEKLATLSYSTYKTLLPRLLDWLQDINYPINNALVPVLLKSGKDLIPHIVTILETEDGVWKYNILEYLVKKMQKAEIEVLMPIIERIATQPTENEVKEEVSIIANEILEM